MSELNTTIPFDPFHTTQHNFRNLTGQTFGRWLVVSIYGRTVHNNVLWLCHCDCGKWGVVMSGDLNSAHSTSCGCWAIEQAQLSHTTHGESNKTAEYRAYHAAKSRCDNALNAAFKHYGGRGIEFRFTSFEEFLNHLGRRPTSKHSLDRIDNDKHYEIDNVRWATKLEQGRNKRDVKMLTLNGESLPLTVWCERYNTSPKRAWTRIFRQGWDVHTALTKPSRDRKSRQTSL